MINSTGMVAIGTVPSAESPSLLDAMMFIGRRGFKMRSGCLRRDREKKSAVGCVRVAARERKGWNTPPGWNLLHKWGSKQWKSKQ
jgi:hypothetical protein